MMYPLLSEDLRTSPGDPEHASESPLKSCNLTSFRQNLSIPTFSLCTRGRPGTLKPTKQPAPRDPGSSRAPKMQLVQTPGAVTLNVKSYVMITDLLQRAKDHHAYLGIEHASHLILVYFQPSD